MMFSSEVVSTGCPVNSLSSRDKLLHYVGAQRVTIEYEWQTVLLVQILHALVDLL